jgi:hypothetical protein
MASACSRACSSSVMSRVVITERPSPPALRGSKAPALMTTSRSVPSAERARLRKPCTTPCSFSCCASRACSCRLHSPSSDALLPRMRSAGRPTRRSKPALTRSIAPSARATAIASGLMRTIWSSMPWARSCSRSRSRSAVMLRLVPHQPTIRPAASRSGSPLERSVNSEPSGSR